MQRYFGTIENEQAILSPESVHHAKDVMRSKIGEEIEIVDQGEVFLCEVTSLSPFSLRVKNALDKDVELEDHLILAFSLLKHGNDEWVLEKGTELGVKTFLPFVSSRSIIRLDEEGKKKKLARFEKIVRGASEQSKRNLVPTVLPIQKYEKALDVAADLKLLAYENVSAEVSTLAESYASLARGKTCVIFIGPEGGFSEEEAKLSLEKGYRFVSLGKRILRAETAAIDAAATFAYEREGKKAC